MGLAYLKASKVDDEPDQPPSAGWKFYNNDTYKYDPDESLSCTEFLNSPPCHLTIRLGGRAKEFQGECEGEYEPTKMISMGRTVMIFICNKQSPPLSQVFKSKVAERFLFVRPIEVSWSISSDLSSDKMYIRSGSAGLRCPASPESKFNEYCNIEDWEFNRDADSECDNFAKGGVVVSCSTCGLSTALWDDMITHDEWGFRLYQKPTAPITYDHEELRS